MCSTDAFDLLNGFSGLKRTGPGVELICLTEGYSMKTIPTKYYNVRYLQLDSSSQKPFLYSRDRSGFFRIEVFLDIQND